MYDYLNLKVNYCFIILLNGCFNMVNSQIFLSVLEILLIIMWTYVKLKVEVYKNYVNYIKRFILLLLFRFSLDINLI